MENDSTHHGVQFFPGPRVAEGTTRRLNRRLNRRPSDHDYYVFFFQFVVQ